MDNSEPSDPGERLRCTLVKSPPGHLESPGKAVGVHAHGGKLSEDVGSNSVANQLQRALKDTAA